MRKDFTRRGVLHGGLGGAIAGAIPFAEWFATYGEAAGQTAFVRYSAHSAAGAAMVAKYRVAVAQMMSRGTGDACGWAFQWYTHQIPSSLSKAAEIAKLPPSQRPLASEMWNTCQAHFGRPLDFFLPWHRMYVYFLERIVRKACGDPKFTLPYWDYMTPAQRSLPASFRTSAGDPLYRVDRNTGGSGSANINGGQAIDIGQPTGALSLQCMQEANYLQSSPLSGDGFCAMINNNPHGLVHSLIGNSVGMGTVPWAANDPIFWLHHANIDRLWASWNQIRQNPTSSAWRNQKFVFADENCNRVEVKVSDFEAIGPLGYAYDALLPVLNPIFRGGIRNLRLIARARPPIPRPGPLRVGLGAAPIEVPLASIARRPEFSAQLRSANLQRIRLRVSGLQARTSPGIPYHLYLNLPRQASAEAARAYYVGTFTFFDVMSADDMAGMPGMGAEGPAYSFDVTALARRLAPSGDLSVTVVPGGRPLSDGASIGEVSLVAG